MAVAAALLDEHDLVDPGLFVAREMFAQLRRRADAAATGIIRQLVLGLQKSLPQIGATGLMLTKQRVIAERIAKKLEPIETAADRFGLVRVTRHAGDDRDVRIDPMPDRHAFLGFDDRVIFLDPFRRLLGFKKRKGQCA